MSDPVARLNAALGGRYAIERELGEGGMAEVVEAWKCRRGHRRQDRLGGLRMYKGAIRCRQNENPGLK